MSAPAATDELRRLIQDRAPESRSLDPESRQKWGELVKSGQFQKLKKQAEKKAGSR